MKYLSTGALVGTIQNCRFTKLKFFQFFSQQLSVKASGNRFDLHNIFWDLIGLYPSESCFRIEMGSKYSLCAICTNNFGIGIAKEDIPKVWKRFYQVRKSSDNSGSGLGLSIVKWIVEAHGGTIELRSSLGIGTEFLIQLPGTAGSAFHSNCMGHSNREASR